MDLEKFYVTFRFYSCYKGMGRVGLAGNEKNGPKRRILRCLGHRYVFFYFLRVLLIFSVLFRFYLHFKMMGKVGLGGNEKNRPKQCILRHLVQRYVFFFISRFSYFI